MIAPEVRNAFMAQTVKRIAIREIGQPLRRWMRAGAIDFSTCRVYLRAPQTFPQRMTLSAVETWSRLLDRARQDIPEQTFRTWLEPTEALKLDGDTILVGAPDQFAAEWNESKHAELISSYAPVALGHPLKVVFRVHEERKTRPQMDLFVAPPAG